MTWGGLGRATFWVFDDGTAAPNPKEHRQGPCWGLVQSDGKALVAGILYQLWLKGDTEYSVGSGEKKYYNGSAPLNVKREAKWNKWDFIFEQGKPASLLLNDKPMDIGTFSRAIWKFCKHHPGGR